MKLKKTCFCWLPLAALILASPACGKGGAPAASGEKGPGAGGVSMQFPVETVLVQDRNAVYTLNAVGSVEAFEKVQVTARVAGVVEKVQFAEGSRVAAGQVLVEIEPQRYTLSVESAQAAHNKAIASKSDAEAGLKRRETVDRQNPGLIPGEEIEAWRTKVLVAAAEMAQAGAALNQAKLNLHDAYVRARSPGWCRRAPCRPGSTCSRGRSWRRWCAVIPCCCASRRPSRTPSACSPA